MNELSNQLPQLFHDYRNHTLDALRWRHFRPRDDDIIVTTAYKAGTTWMQTIVGNLIFAGHELPAPIMQLSPWLEMCTLPLDDLMSGLDAQTHRRFIKTHLPLDGVPYYQNVKYIFVGRDPRDVFMSLWNHHHSHTDQFFDRINTRPGRVGPPLARCPDDIHEFWHGWISKGLFDWESDGYPYWSFFHHAQTWWDFRHLPNIYFAHYNDLLSNLEDGMRAVAAFLALEIEEDLWPGLVHACRFETMKNNPSKVMTSRADEVFKNGAMSFIHKGTNGRWRDVLTADELAMYDDVKTQSMTPDLAAWLERGGPI